MNEQFNIGTLMLYSLSHCLCILEYFGLHNCIMTKAFLKMQMHCILYLVCVAHWCAIHTSFFYSVGNTECLQNVNTLMPVTKSVPGCKSTYLFNNGYEQVTASICKLMWLLHFNML